MTSNPIKVLLVEDDEGMEKIVRAWFRMAKGMNFDLVWANSLGQGLEMLGAGEIDIILLDLNLPDSMGLDTIARTYSAAPHVPIIVLTGNDSGEIGVNSLKMGAENNGFKPSISVILFSA